MKQTAVEWLINEMHKKEQGLIETSYNHLFDQAKEMEKKQLFLASNTSAKEAYKAGQASMYCGCYEYEGCTTYEDWLYKKSYNKEEE